MSMEAHALCDRPLRSVSEWQAAIDALGFELTLDPDVDLASAAGHLPASWRGQEAGFECSAGLPSELIETYPRVDFGGPWPCGYDFVFHTMPGAAGTWMAVAACITATGGMAYEPQEALLLNAEEATRYARQIVADVEGEIGS